MVLATMDFGGIGGIGGLGGIGGGGNILSNKSDIKLINYHLDSCFRLCLYLCLKWYIDNCIYCERNN